MSLKEKIQLKFFKQKWRHENKHNGTYPANLFNQNLVKVGKMTYGEIHLSAYSDNYYLTIGSFCSIGPNVEFLLSSDHFTDSLSTFPFKVKYGLENKEGISKGNIKVEDDVWIGERAIILSGICIHQGAVIAAGAVVTKDVPPYAIVGGVPAKIIKYRFDERTIRELLKIDFDQINKNFVVSNIKNLYKKVDINQLAWTEPIKKKE